MEACYGVDNQRARRRRPAPAGEAAEPTDGGRTRRRWKSRPRFRQGRFWKKRNIFPDPPRAAGTTPTIGNNKGIASMQGIRAKILAIVGLLSVGLVLMGLVGIYQLNHLAREGNEAMVKLKTAIALVDTARSAQHHFKIQVQEWKNIPHPGGDAAAFDKYLQGLRRRGAQGSGAPGRHQDIAAKLGLDGRIDPAPLIAAHAKLENRYRAALQAHDRSRPDFTQAADKAVRGIDRPVDEGIDKINKEGKTIAEEIEAAVTKSMAEEAATTRNTPRRASRRFASGGLRRRLAVANRIVGTVRRLSRHAKVSATQI